VGWSSRWPSRAGDRRRRLDFYAVSPANESLQAEAVARLPSPARIGAGANCSKAETALDAAQDAHSARRSREQVSARRGRAEGNGWRLQSTPRGAASHARAAPASTIGTRRHSLTISAEAPPPRLPG
jgi:hypothetical protein